MARPKPRQPTSAEILGFLGRISPFKDLPPQDRKRIASACAPIHCRRKEVVFLEGTPAQYAWVLYSGRLGIMAASHSGRRQELEHIIPGELFGTLCRIFNHARDYPCTAEAMADSVALRIPEGLFRDSFSGNADLMTQLCALCAERLAKMKELPRMAMEPPRARLAFAVSRLFSVYGKRIPIREREIADLAGIAPETAYRTLHEFRSERLISSEPHHVVVLDPKAIHAVWSEESAALRHA